mmetsp:Transcript_36950/g.66461  ORF Transcript_36950/g.66461 Transcript_36950/m.66461 type:complete len:258 (+) Transcript_36950:147-920(+)
MGNTNPPKSQGYTILTLVFAITAFCLMWAGSIRCNFLKFDSVSGTDETFSMELGMWYYSYWSFLVSSSGTYIFESCNTYPDITEIDATWKTAQAFGIISFILGLCMLVFACVFGCATGCGEETGYALTHVWEAPMYLLTSITQGLVLLLLSSNACNSKVLTGLGGDNMSNVTFSDTCSISTGAKLVISATVFWFSAAVASFFAHKAEKAEMAGDGGGEAGMAEKAEEGEASKIEEAEAEDDKPEQAVPEETVSEEGV